MSDQNSRSKPSERFQHRVNNTLNAISIQAELACLLLERNESEPVHTILQKIIAECRNFNRSEAPD
jgi:hypothetical protein